jgi:hypothetical protein
VIGALAGLVSLGAFALAGLVLLRVSGRWHTTGKTRVRDLGKAESWRQA